MDHDDRRQHEKKQAKKYKNEIHQQINKTVVVYDEQTTNGEIHRVVCVRSPTHFSRIPAWTWQRHHYDNVTKASASLLKYTFRWQRREAPLAGYLRLLPSDAVAKAKKRAREVILTLLLVARRAAWPHAPREIWQRILGEVNKEECDL